MERLTLNCPARLLAFSTAETAQAGPTPYRRQLALRIKNDLEVVRQQPTTYRHINHLFKFLAAAASIDPTTSEAAPNQPSSSH